MSEFQVHISNS